MIVIKQSLSIKKIWLVGINSNFIVSGILKAHQYNLQSPYKNKELFTFSFYFKRYRTLTLNAKLHVDKISAIGKGL